jgi:hypothetical protein
MSSSKKPLKIEMPFDEAMRRAVRVPPKSLAKKPKSRKKKS